MFWKNKPKPSAFDADIVRPVLKCSICTGEQVACLQNKATGHVEEIMLIRNDADLARFRQLYGIAPGDPLPRIY